MSNSLVLQPTQEKRRSRVTKTDIVTSPSLRVSVIHSEKADVERSIEQLARAHYRVTAELVLTLEQFMSLTAAMEGETIADLIRKGATDCDRIENMRELPASVLNIRGGTAQMDSAPKSKTARNLRSCLTGIRSKIPTGRAGALRKADS